MRHRREQLLRRIRARYQTITEITHVGPLAFPFTRIADPNRVLDEVAAAEDFRERWNGPRPRPGQPRQAPLHLPYWAELWDSAQGLGQFLATHGLRPPGDFRRTRVLDLGCGMGLSGAVAARLGGEVLFADLETPALLFAQLNSLSLPTRTRARQLNWQTDRLNERFDLILGADILYEKAQWEFLDPFWKAHLAEEGRILLGEPGRPSGDQFIAWIETRGWELRLFQQPVPGRGVPIRLLDLRR